MIIEVNDTPPIGDPLEQPSLRSSNILPDRVGLADIEQQRAKGWPDFHPEDYCHKCGHRNIPSWYTDSDRFNLAMGEPGEVLYQGIVCPTCFVLAHQEVSGLKATWRLVPENFTAIANDTVD